MNRYHVTIPRRGGGTSTHTVVAAHMAAAAQLYPHAIEIKMIGSRDTSYTLKLAPERVYSTDGAVYVSGVTQYD